MYRILCMYIYIHVKYSLIHNAMYTHTDTDTDTYTDTYIYRYMYICIMHIHIHTYIHIHINIHIYIYMYICIQTEMHMTNNLQQVRISSTLYILFSLYILDLSESIPGSVSWFVTSVYCNYGPR